LSTTLQTTPPSRSCWTSPLSFSRSF
jgi:hypothetical protein